MKELEELLDMEFGDDESCTLARLQLHLTTKDASIIYFALKNYIGHISNTGGSMHRITTTVELVNTFKEDAREYMTELINNLKGSNLLEQDNIQDIDNKLKEELV